MTNMHIFDKVRKWFKHQEGVALVITLLITLVLVLLGLSLLLQSSTDYLVSVNEQDATKSLGYAEAGLDILTRLVRDYALQATAPSDLSDLLNGPDNASAADDHLPDLTAYGVGLGRVLDVTKTPADFTTSNEKTLAVIDTINSKTYEVIRMGEDNDNNGTWDGNTRALIYLRLEDNYDPVGGNDVADTDFNAQALVAADYPIFINSDGSPASNQVIKQRGRARRMLLARMSPAGRNAIRTDGDLSIAGNLMVCGECGGVHANQQLTIGGAHTCAEATATQNLNVTNTGADIRGGAGVTQPIYIPEINPYDDRYVPPSPVTTPGFWTLSNNVPWHAECGAWDATTNPGATRYFAFVALPHNGNVDLRVYKAYWDSTNSHWIWRLIDDNLTGTLNLDAKLDNCGRLISSHIAGTTADPGATAGVDDGSTSEFYGFGVSNGSRYGSSCGTPGDDTLTVASRDGHIVNDWNNTKFNAFSETATPLFPQVGAADISDTPTLPGTRMNNSGDGTLDFTYNANITQNKAEWSMNGQVVWSPLYGAVIFVYGNVQLNGGNDYKYWNGSAIQTVNGALPDSRWRVSWIVYNTIDFSGNPSYAPVTDSFGATLVAGRDIELSGTGGGGPGNQDQCPDMNGTTDCTTPPASTAAGFAGMVLAHEQINFTGNITIDGFIIAEDAAACSPTANNSSISTGSVQIHYDCNNPPDPWASRSVRVNSWAEIQQ